MSGKPRLMPMSKLIFMQALLPSSFAPRESTHSADSRDLATA